MTTVAITGNTYPVKDQLKALGGRWNAAGKAWMVPAEKAAEAQALVGGASKPVARSYTPRNYGRSQARWSGCSCGSRDGEPRASDCASCRHDY